MVITAYKTEEEMKGIITSMEAQGFTLVEVQNITEGNFLGFREPGWLPPTEAATLTEQIAALQAADLDNKEMIATLYELTMGGVV